MAHYTVRRDLYTSKLASGFTSETYRVADAEKISLFISGSPSTTTVQGSNADGLSSDITNTLVDWSHLSTILDPGTTYTMIDIEPGFNYLRCIRSETTSVLLQARMAV